MGVKKNSSATSPIVEAVGSGEFKQEIEGAINWGGEEVRENPMGDEEAKGGKTHKRWRGKGGREWKMKR